MTVASYRDWIGHVRVSLAEFVHAKTDEDKFIGALRVAHNVMMLANAELPICSEKIRTQATFWMRRANDLLKEEGFNELVKMRNAQDMLITKLAYAEEWK